MENRETPLNAGFENFFTQRRNLLLFCLALLLAITLSFGFGYFFGRLEQIQISKSILKVIPDINCLNRRI